MNRINSELEKAIDDVSVSSAPPRLASAMRYAVFPGGARIRPRLCFAVAQSLGEDAPAVTAAAAASIELMHCASLVHDDLPCFDDADIRRGKPSVHKAYGEDLAVLVGDGLIVLAFDLLARVTPSQPGRLCTLMQILARSVGAVSGIVAGQAWESEEQIDLAQYQRAKTGALFAAATECGAAAVGADSSPWRMLGEKLGEAYQVADDLQDVLGNPGALGKPVGQDASLGRPSVAHEFGVAGATAQLKHQVSLALASIPDCPGRETLTKTILSESSQFLPRDLLKQAA